MRVPRVYIKTPLSAHTDFDLCAETSHYLLKVLRMSEGRSLIVFDGGGGEYEAHITACTKKYATIQTSHFKDTDNESPLNSHLAIGISRGDRFDWVLQKATELGITEITPLFTERTEVKLAGDRLQKKVDHWQQITLSACEQCQRNTPPVFNLPLQLTEYISRENAEYKSVLHHRSEKSVHDIPTPSSCALLIGPEGGLSEAEIALAFNYGFNALTLGPRVLRTETAPIVALSIFQMKFGDL